MALHIKIPSETIRI